MSRAPVGKGRCIAAPFFVPLERYFELTNNQSGRNRVKILGKKDFACVC
jgi:hypothetical protein